MATRGERQVDQAACTIADAPPHGSITTPARPGPTLLSEADWRFIIAENERKLRSYLRRFERDPDEAAELLQAIWALVAVRSSGREARPGESEIFDCCREVVRDRARQIRGARAIRQWWSEPLLDSTHESEADALERELARMAKADLAWRMVARLPTRQREAVIHRFAYDHSEKQTATMMGCAIGTVKAHVHQAITRIRQTLAAD